MKLRAFLGIGLLLSLPAIAAPPPAPSPLGQLSPHELIQQVIYNEIKDREGTSCWEYRVVRTTGTWTITADQIETRYGPIHRMVAAGGVPLTSVEQREENARLESLVNSPGEQARVEQQYEQDEARLERLMALMPTAFLFDYDGREGTDIVRLKFRPDPGYTPPNFESRVFHTMAGTVWISMRQKRISRMRAQIVERVDLGFGLLGHVEKGGTFEIERRPVNATHWKTSLVDVHIDGKILLFKTITKDQHEVRSGFKPMPLDITLSQAKKILNREAGVPGGESR